MFKKTFVIVIVIGIVIDSHWTCSVYNTMTVLCPDLDMCILLSLTMSKVLLQNIWKSL